MRKEKSQNGEIRFRDALINYARRKDFTSILIMSEEKESKLIDCITILTSDGGRNRKKLSDWLRLEIGKWLRKVKKG